MSEPINDDPEKVISLIQVLDDLNSETIQLKTEAEDLECTYELGPINQPVMVCKTCSIDPTKLPNGVCASCAQKCHEGHDLLELYSKRDFICECGTDKLNTSCKFNDRLPNPVKREKIETNFYNHNFEGLYCL
jgi:E3 ubiquitin-protein ligase UBR7